MAWLHKKNIYVLLWILNTYTYFNQRFLGIVKIVDAILLSDQI